MGLQDTFATHQTYWSFDESELSHTQDAHQTDEHKFVIPDLLLPGMLAMQNPMSSPSQPPMVQGTPQFGGVPSVQGTPAVPGNLAQPAAGAVHGPALSAPSSAPQEADAHPMYHRQVQQSHYQSTTHPQQPAHQQSVSSGNEFEHKHHHSGSLHKHHKHGSKLHHSTTTSSKAGMSIVSKWLIVVVVSLVVIGTSSVLLVHALMPTTVPPALSITGSNVVRAGDVMHIHGQGFQSGDVIVLTIDNGVPVSFVGQHGTQALAQSSESNVQIAGLAQMNIAGAFHSRTPDNAHITVSSSGTFDAYVTVPASLSEGQHVLHATGNQSSKSASLQFTVTSSQLVVNPTALNFGSVEVGRTVKLLVTVNNLGGASLHWTATVEGSHTNWLTLSKNSGVLGTNGANETVIVTANTNGLTVGSHYATLHFHSNNGDVLIIANIHVVSVGQIGQHAILNVSQQSLDFGQLQEGQSAQKSVSIANLGNLPLQWQASVDTASANWLSLSTNKGTVQQGAVPQTVQVNVDTSGLAAGSYSGTVNITSNGGNAQVKVRLVVKASPRPPVVTGINPASGPASGGTTVTISGTGFTGATSVSFGTAGTSIISIKSDTQIMASSPAGSGTVDITVTTPVGTSATSSADQFTYTSTTTVPKVTGINPTSGSNTGGTSVTISGTGFSGATSVSFGTKPASTFTVVSDTQVTATSPAGSGTVDVTVTTPVATSATSSADQFTYTIAPPPVPKVTSISPNSGPDTGGTSVTISGTGFSSATGVSFGSTNASTFTVVSDTQITAKSPAGSGTVDVTVTTPSGTSATSSGDQFTYNAAQPPTPTVSGVSPSSGSSNVGTSVTISGTGFTGATSVLFGKNPASSFTVVSDKQITATSPVGSGTVDVTVTTPSGTSATSSGDQFTYNANAAQPPTVTSINPTGGYTTGGTSVTIIGTGFTGASSVSFGKSAASSFTVVSDTQITATSPAGSGTVDITVTTSSGTSATSSADQFTYSTPPPTVTNISPQGGYTTGGTSVTITGTGFTGASSVSFGKSAASSFTVVSDTQITATSPVGSGTVDITVTTSSGTSATSSADQFTYSTPSLQ
jgi:uncharacterized membrane protein